MDQLWAIRQHVDPPRARVTFVNYKDFAVFGARCSVVANEGCFFCRLMHRAGLLGRQSPVEAALVRRVSGGPTGKPLRVCLSFSTCSFPMFFAWISMAAGCPISLATRSAMSTRTV